MFFTKIFKTIDDVLKSHKQKIEELEKRINIISDKVISEVINEIEKHNKKIDALTEFLKSDRNDINALIQIVRKLQSNKGKK